MFQSHESHTQRRVVRLQIQYKTKVMFEH